MFFPNMAGVISLGDLLDGKSKIIDFKAFMMKFNINCNILFYYKVIKSVRKDC